MKIYDTVTEKTTMIELEREANIFSLDHHLPFHEVAHYFWLCYCSKLESKSLPPRYSSVPTD